VPQTSCATWEGRTAGHFRDLIFDESQVEGTRYSTVPGGFGNWGRSCNLGNGGPGSTYLSHLGAGTSTLTVSTRNANGTLTYTSADVDALPRAKKFSGCSSSHKQEIESAIKKVVKELQTGCIRDNAALDNTIAAFDDRLLSRSAFHERILDELHNLDNISFICEQMSSCARWGDHTNEIKLNFETCGDNGPNVPYVVMHELAHKAGFNGSLLGHYTHKSIEEQAHDVLEACNP